MSQELPLVEQLKNLERLQELDLKIDLIRKNQSNLPQNLKVLDDSLYKLQTSLGDKKNQIAEQERTHRQVLAALDMNKERLNRASSKLEAVHNSHEYQAATKEIDQLKKLGHSLEDQSKKSQDELDKFRNEFKVLEAEVETLKQDRDSKAGLLAGQDKVYQGDLDTLISARTEYVSKVERRILAQYDRVRVARGGLGIVPVVSGRCKGCNMMVPPQLFNEVQRGTVLHSCPSCHRLLFDLGSTEKMAAKTDQT